MQFSQSRISKRGALIAVIKIEIDAERADRIFLHQNDDDYKLAQQFVEKNRVNPSFTQHIYQRIVFSRHSVEAKQGNINNNPTATPFTPTPPPQTRGEAQGIAKHVTPYNNLVSNRDQQQYQLSQSFGQLLKRGNNQTTQNVPSLFQTNEDENFTQNKRDNLVQNKKILQAPVKKLFDDKQFKLYIDQDNDTNNKLFQSQKKQQPIKICHSPRVEKQRQSYNSIVSSNKSNKIQEYLQQRETVSDYLKKCQSLQKCQTTANLKSVPYAQKNERINKSVKKSDIQKPLHVKIFKKDELLSMNHSLKKSMSKQQISRINKDVTSRLYNEADIKKNLLNIIKQKAKKEKQLLEDVQLTHRPEINPISKVIAEGRRKKQTPIQSYLIEEGKKVEQRKQEQEGKRHLKQIQNCTFEPQLNLISRKLAEERSKFDSKASNRRSNYRDQNLFHPSLNRVTYQLMKNRGKFEDRQRDFLQSRNNKLVLEVRKKRDGEKIDCETGQQLFRPKINDIGVRASLGPKIGDYLYQLGRKGDSPKQQPSCRPSISSQSQNLAHQLYSKRISWIFSELDSDQDGIITPQKVSISTIPTELLEIIKPILFELQEINEALNLTEFRNAVEILHKKLSPYEKNILYYSKVTL